MSACGALSGIVKGTLFLSSFSGIADTVFMSLPVEGEGSLTQVLQSILNSFLDLCRCDGGTVYALRKNAQGREVLVFEAMITRSMQVSRVPDSIRLMEFNIDESTVVGRSACRREFIKESFGEKAEVMDYRTRNILSGPLITPRGDLVGVVQLLNKVPYNREKDGVLIDDFDSRDERLFSIVAGQAALAIENSLLLAEQERLLEGFVDAFVTAVESRDPVTSGHSHRVADLSVALAEAVNHESDGQLGLLKFDRTQIREIRFAAMLHDIGKVSVSEAVLNKEKKLYHWELEAVRLRLQLIRSRLRLEEKERPSLELRRLITRADRAWNEILKANEPSILSEDVSEALSELKMIKVQGEGSEILSVLTDVEFTRLALKKGSLTEAERAEIEKHVTFTFQILKRVPWSRGLELVPQIAYCHHEKLDGSGYPLKIPGPEIPIQGRMLAICDIYDALTADDRPYKRALPVERALEIIDADVKRSKLDHALFRCFAEARVYEVLAIATDRSKKAA